MGYAYGTSSYAAGDYAYQAGGIFGSIGKALGGLAKTAVGFIPGPVGTIARTVVKAVSGGPPRPQLPARFAPPGGLQIPGGPQIQRLQDTGPGPYGGQPGIQLMGRRRRRMNPMNVGALRRASRRIDGFARVARRALKHTPWVLVSRGSRRGGRGGSPGVITRAEAAKALRR